MNPWLLYLSHVLIVRISGWKNNVKPMVSSLMIEDTYYGLQRVRTISFPGVTITLPATRDGRRSTGAI
jgi:hypothetical protein